MDDWDPEEQALEQALRKSANAQSHRLTGERRLALHHAYETHRGRGRPRWYRAFPILAVTTAFCLIALLVIPKAKVDLSAPVSELATGTRGSDTPWPSSQDIDTSLNATRYRLAHSHLQPRYTRFPGTRHASRQLSFQIDQFREKITATSVQ